MRLGTSVSCLAGLCCVVLIWVSRFTPEIASAQKTTALPRVLDDRLEIQLVASAPQIVHPIALDCDAQGHLLVVESHTHFRPKNYTGPQYDRILRVQDSDGDGRADRITTFFEGTTATMDLAVHPDGSIYIATRNEILRLRDRDGDGQADEKVRLIFLETPGNYPHNGLAGLCFDANGDLYFGLGENLGEPYKLHGADGITLSGGGEGGNVYHCTAEGKKLRRVATGFWNPFGIGRDSFGRVLIVDNDPDASPPCRLVQLVEGGDYGYQFRYGRSGRHPFQAWNGELPGTLPYISGTGEAPCEVLCYESDGLPREYFGSWLVPAWADHRLEQYILRREGAGYRAERHIVVQGNQDFFPSGLTVAPDGSLYVSDWGSRSYELHGRGALWRIRRKNGQAVARPARPEQAVLSQDRTTRERAAQQLRQTPEGRRLLHQLVKAEDVHVQATALTALHQAEASVELLLPLTRDPNDSLRELAFRLLLQLSPSLPEERWTELLEGQPPAVLAWAIADPQVPLNLDSLRSWLQHPDPFLRHAAIQRLARNDTLRHEFSQRIEWGRSASNRERQLRIGLLLADQRSTAADRLKRLPTYLNDPDPQVRFLAVKWISDENLQSYRPDLLALLTPYPSFLPENENLRMYTAIGTALARLDGKPVHEAALVDYFFQRVKDPNTPKAIRRAALQAIPASYKPLTTRQLIQWLAESDEPFQVEVLRLLQERGDKSALEAVYALATNPRLPTSLRCQAIVTLSALTNQTKPFLSLVRDQNLGVVEEALRALNGARLGPSELRQIKQRIEQHYFQLEPLVRRLEGDKDLAERQRPRPDDLEGWIRFLRLGGGYPDVGRWIFESPRLAGCSKCHRVEGRGNEVGPDLSHVGRNELRFLLEALLQPSAVVAPRYQTWQITTADERVRLGMLIGTHYDEVEYLDEKGQRFRLRNSEIVSVRAVPQSLMPEGLLDQLTDQEIRHLFTYLQSLR